MDTKNRSIVVAVQKDQFGLYGSGGCNKRISCLHQRLNNVVVTTAVYEGECVNTPAGNVYPAGTIVPNGVDCVEIKDPNLGLIYVLKSSYDAQIDSCNDCCISNG